MPKHRFFFKMRSFRMYMYKNESGLIADDEMHRHAAAPALRPDRRSVVWRKSAGCTLRCSASSSCLCCWCKYLMEDCLCNFNVALPPAFPAVSTVWIFGKKTTTSKQQTQLLSWARILLEYLFLYPHPPPLFFFLFCFLNVPKQPSRSQLSPNGLLRHLASL